MIRFGKKPMGNNTVHILIEKKAKDRGSGITLVKMVFSLLGAIIIAWVPIVLFYEIPSSIGERYDVDWEIVKKALRAEHAVTMKHRTRSESLNRVLHELEEMKEFYSQF